MDDFMELYYSLYNTIGNHFLNTSLDLFMECSIEVVSLEDSINYSIEIQDLIHTNVDRLSGLG
jgi:hypothetical protein